MAYHENDYRMYGNIMCFLFLGTFMGDLVTVACMMEGLFLLFVHFLLRLILNGSLGG